MGRKWHRGRRPTVDKAGDLCSNKRGTLWFRICLQQKDWMAFCDGIKTSRDIGPVIQTCGYSLNQLQSTESKKGLEMLSCGSLDLVVLWI